MSTNKNTLDFCQECGSAHPVYEVKDLEVKRKGLSKTVRNVAAWFCEDCGEIHFDPATDSLERWSEAGNQLVLAARENAKKVGKKLHDARRTLKISQIEAALLSGGGHNAFSRYERGEAVPVAAVATLFGLLKSHPNLLPEAKSLAVQYKKEFA